MASILPALQSIGWGWSDPRWGPGTLEFSNKSCLPEPTQLEVSLALPTGLHPRLRFVFRQMKTFSLILGTGTPPKASPRH